MTHVQVTNNVPKVDCSEATSVPVIMKQGQPEYDIEMFQKFRGVLPVMLVLTCLHCGSPATLSLSLRVLWRTCISRWVYNVVVTCTLLAIRRML